MRERKTDRKSLNRRVLIAGFTTRHVACSAHAAGYRVCVVDHFCDKDLSRYADDSMSFDDLESLPPAIEHMSGKHRCDIFVPTSGAEMLPVGIPRYGPAPEKAATFLDKERTSVFFQETGVPAPATLPVQTYPAMVKPRSGSGGWRNSVLHSDDEWRKWKEDLDDPPALWQEVVQGIPASVCCVTDGTRARAVAVNEQLLRGGEDAAYGFSGSVTPFIHPLADVLARCAEKIASASGCIGTIGIDFVVGETPYAIEVNPRFQGTVDTVEMATGKNLFSLHVDACEGRIPEKMPEARQFAARKILFARDEFVVGEDLGLFPFVSDIPWPGSFIEKGGAIVSVYGWGQSRRDAILMLDKHISTVQQ
ncbi:MAG: ATP-grasp domain-containing protein, partial [Methanomicrobiales archaeon]